MVSSTLCLAVHTLGSQNVYGRAEGIADHYWPWAVVFLCSPIVSVSGHLIWLFLAPLRPLWPIWPCTPNFMPSPANQHKKQILHASSVQSFPFTLIVSLFGHIFCLFLPPPPSISNSKVVMFPCIPNLISCPAN